MPHVTVTEIYTYPVKSCRGTLTDAADIAPTGIEGDRQLMVLKEGKFTNQAFVPSLATIATRRVDANTIAFSAEGHGELIHTVGAGGAESAINFYGNDVPVIDQGDALASWLSDATGTDLRVAGLKDTFTRAVPLAEFGVVDGIDQSRFVDVAPLLVTNTASLDDLNGRLEAPVPMNRFRPNVVIEGLDAFREDEVTALSIEGLKLVRATHCERCGVTCTDQETGERAKEPLAALRAYRHRENGYAGGVMFGAYMGVEGSATLRVGDTLEVS